MKALFRYFHMGVSVDMIQAAIVDVNMGSSVFAIASS
jgi:hypothetical protein